MASGGSGPATGSGGGGGVGVSMADVLLLKPFFQAQGLLPANKIFEDLFSWPTQDFANMGGPVPVISESYAKSSPSSGVSNFGFDLGASYGEVLYIVGGMRPAANAINLAIFDGIPPDTNLTGVKAFQLDLSLFSSATRILLNNGGSLSVLATETTVQPVGAAGPTYSCAIYYKQSTGHLKVFLRIGSECWWPILEVTDTSLASVRAVGIWMSGTALFKTMCPTAAYAA